MKTARQVAALPVRRDEAGELQVLLVTSRETRRWVIPKGWPWADRADHRAAAEEAREEAGVRGKIRKAAIGSYGYDKRLKAGSRPVVVDVYLLVVTRELDVWPEDDERTRAWLSPAQAADAVDEQELKALLRDLAETITPILDKLQADKRDKVARKSARKAKRETPTKKKGKGGKEKGAKKGKRASGQTAAQSEG